MKSILKFLIVPMVMAAAGGEDADKEGVVHHQWDYADENGADWASLSLTKQVQDPAFPNDKTKTKTVPNTNYCKKGNAKSWNQSPIDLRTDWPQKSAGFDNFNKIYSNVYEHLDTATETVVNGAAVNWNGHTSQVNFPPGSLQRFQSWHSQKTFGGPANYYGLQFHFHHRSEHTVNGKYHDLEMHTVNLPYPATGDYNGFMAAAMGLMFSVNDYTREMEPWEQDILDTFFENLKWDDTSKDVQVVDEASYGDLMTMVDMNNRWTYRGSVTTPPCAQNVYWNVLRTIYPIKQSVLDNFQRQLMKGHGICSLTPEGNLPKYCIPGNNREILDLSGDHEPYIITDGADLSRSVRAQNQYTSNDNTQNILTQTNLYDSLEETADHNAGVAPKVGEDSSALTTTITVLLIIAILFLLLAVIIVTKNSFNKPVAYQGVEQGTLPTDRN